MHRLHQTHRHPEWPLFHGFPELLGAAPRSWDDVVAVAESWNVWGNSGVDFGAGDHSLHARFHRASDRAVYGRHASGIWEGGHHPNQRHSATHPPQQRMREKRLRGCLRGEGILESRLPMGRQIRWHSETVRLSARQFTPQSGCPP